MPETIVMKVVDLTLRQQDDDDGKPTGKEYITVRMTDINLAPDQDRWEVTTLTLRDRMIDLRLGDKVTVTVEKAP